MKKLSVLLAVIMILSVLASCGSTEDTSAASEEASAEASVEASAEESKEISQEISEEKSKEETSADEPEEYTYATVVSVGKSYTLSAKPGDAYPDSYNSELTDSLFAPEEDLGYSETKLVGIAANFEIVIDLDEVQDKIYGFEMSYYSTYQAGIAPPSLIKVSVSEDNDKWTKVGYCKIPSEVNDTMLKAVLTLKHSVSARYIKFEVNRSSAWVFIDEFSVIADIESDASSEKWAESILELYNEEKALDKATVEAISGSAPDKTLSRTNIAKGCSYSSAAKIDSTFSENNKKLTDGNALGFYESGGWLGYITEDADIDIIVTLGKVQSDICEFELYAYNNPALGICFPSKVTVSVSSDKKNWVEVGYAYAPKNSSNETHTFVLTLSKTVTAKYVKFTLNETDCKMFLIEELGVIAYRNESVSTSLYPALSFPEVEKDEYWQKSESDYSETINLISGLTQQISGGSIDEGFWSNNTSVTEKLLTDGKFSSNTNIHGGGYFKFNGGTSREIFYDLTKISTLKEFRASFTQQSEWAVNSPSIFSVYVSSDAENWYFVGSGNVTYKSDPGKATGTLTLENPIEARFVCFSFSITVWCGCDELEVYGTKKADKTHSIEKSGLSVDNSFMVGSYAMVNEELLGGVHDIYLTYHSTTFSHTVEDLLPILAYTDTDGNMKDVMFDGFLFLLSGTLPSGNAGYQGFTKSDCEWLISTLFADNTNVGALEKAAATVKSALKLPDDYKFKFYIGINYPGASSFGGDIDGDGKNEDMSVLADQVKVIEWYISLVEAKVKEMNYNNIELCGYYWYHEAMEDSKGDVQLLPAVANVIHNHDSQFFWIPYYQASGYASWVSRGFDVACMQPNYAFRAETPISNIYNCATAAKRYGMCIEIEMDGRALSDESYRNKYFDYLRCGAECGFMKDVIHMYYLETTAMYKASISNGESRDMYDLTYQFIKGTLNITPDTVSDINIMTSENTAVDISLNTSGNESYAYKFDSSPAHGTVTVDEDGNATYYPEKGYKGSDSFTYSYSEHLGYSAPCTVNITVE